MTLDELKFNEAEFWKEQRELHMPTPHATYEQWADWACRQANRILEEKLKRAPEIEFAWDKGGLIQRIEAGSYLKILRVTRESVDHKARLVCVEEIK